MSAFPTLGGRDPNSAAWKTAQSHWDNVQVVRACLQLAGAFDAPRGGNWDVSDAGAVEWFQGTKNLTRDGIVGDATWSRLLHVSSV